MTVPPEGTTCRATESSLFTRSLWASGPAVGSDRKPGAARVRAGLAPRLLLWGISAHTSHRRGSSGPPKHPAPLHPGQQGSLPGRQGQARLGQRLRSTGLR